jgi:predicted TIM-barrel fold metal-dependent hydrolase
MRLISLVQPTNFAVHGIIAFDPWRYLEHPKAVLAVVKNAIEKQGFIGVKIYPPMGFQASGNANLGDQEFPKRLRREFHPHTGLKIDNALDALYDYCNRNDVPIMVHCSPSIGAGPGYELRADPKYWKAVLAKYKKLRVNLGHFGGIWNFAKTDSTNWTAEIGELMKTYGDRTYADVGDFSGVLDRWREAGQTSQIFQNLQVLVGNVANFAQQVLYGSDFHLLGREPMYEQYYAKMRDKYQYYLGAANIAPFLGGNAKTFFGLHAGQPARKRLEKFYQGHPMPNFDVS